MSPTTLGSFHTRINTGCLGDPSDNTAAVNFINGPATPPLGTGSFHFTIGSDGDSSAEIHTTDFDGTRLANVTSLSYSTYVSANNGGQAAYLEINLDTDGNLATTADVDQLFFEPVYQTGSYSSVGSPAPIAQGTLTTNTWQTWDALQGGWWSNNQLLGGPSGPPVFTIAYFLTVYPNAIIENDTSTFGGVRVRAGCGGAAWANFDGNIDNLTVGVSGTNSTYDFELTPPASHSSGGSSSTISFPQAPPVPLCSLIDGTTTPFIRASVPNGAATYNGTWANVYCGVLTDPVQYGVFDRTVIHAVEVFALTAGEPTVSVTKFSAPVLLCLQGSGAMLYRDATSAPRVVTTLPSFSQGDFTCANLPNAGTAILVAGAPSPAAASPDLSVGSSSALDICQITTLGILNLRQTPELSGTVLDRVPNNTTLKATAKQGDWFEVVFGSNQGWVSAKLVSTDGFCQ